MATPLYDAFSQDYDRFVDWDGRLAHELPFIERQLEQVGAHRILDAACGTGRHAIALAERGYWVTGADLSAGMVDRAQANAAGRGQDIPFAVAGFGQLAEEVGGGFDALLCLGNSLPHVLTASELEAALSDFAAALRPRGLLLVQNRNFDAVVADQIRWMPPQSHYAGGREWLFLRFYDFRPDGTLTFNVVTLRRDGSGDWEQRVEATLLRPWLSGELSKMVALAGFGDIACLGDVSGAPFDPPSSDNLILTACRT
jgi:SAM-dependent methyltransferase